MYIFSISPMYIRNWGEICPFVQISYGHTHENACFNFNKHIQKLMLFPILNQVTTTNTEYAI